MEFTSSSDDQDGLDWARPVFACLRFRPEGVVNVQGLPKRYARVAWSPVLVISGFYGDHPMANDNADPDNAVDIQCETKAEHERLDEVELEMKQQHRLMDSFSRLGWYDDREAVIAFCVAREKAQDV